MNMKSVSGSQLSATKRSSDWTSATPLFSRYLETTRPSSERQTPSGSRPAASASAIAAEKWTLAISVADISAFPFAFVFHDGGGMQLIWLKRRQGLGGAALGFPAFAGTGSG